MTMPDECAAMRLLIQAGTDGELSAADSAGVAAHLDGCASCAEVERQLLALSARLRREAPRHAAPPALRAAVQARIAAAAPPSARWRPPLRMAASFGAGMALAASIMLTVVSPRQDVADLVVAGHIRALQPGHLTDVVSGDQHTVKPWFDGRLDFAPPVKDLAGAGFPLAGGRLDYLGGRAVAALAYQRRQHVIDLFVWPQPGASQEPAASALNGYNVLRWRRDGMAFWAVSAVGAGELAEFAQLWNAH